MARNKSSVPGYRIDKNTRLIVLMAIVAFCVLFVVWIYRRVKQTYFP